MTISPGMQRKSVADATSVLDIVSAAGYVYYSGGELNYSGGVISGVASYTWAQFNDVLFDTTLARYVHITDRHSTTDGTSTPGSLWWVDPTATAIRKRNLVSGPIYYSTYAAAIADVPVATWPTMRIRCADVGNARFQLVSNGTRYLPEGGRVYLSKNVYGTLALPTNTIGTGTTAYQFNIGTPTFPANLFATPDTLILMLRFQRHFANATMTLKASLGTAGDSTDDSMYIQTIAATDNIQGGGFVISDIASSTKYITNTSNGITTGGAASYLLDKTTKFDTTSIMKLAFTGTKNTNDTIDLLSYSLEWLAA